jgi:hypothetical protein
MIALLMRVWRAEAARDGRIFLLYDKHRTPPLAFKFPRRGPAAHVRAIKGIF